MVLGAIANSRWSARRRSPPGGSEKLSERMTELVCRWMVWKALTHRLVETVSVCSDSLSEEGLSQYSVGEIGVEDVRFDTIFPTRMGLWRVEPHVVQ